MKNQVLGPNIKQQFNTYSNFTVSGSNSNNSLTGDIGIFFAIASDELKKEYIKIVNELCI